MEHRTYNIKHRSQSTDQTSRVRGFWSVIHDSRGFTLIEAIICIAIIVIMAGVLVFSLAPARRTQIMKDTTDDTVALLNEARARTLSSENSLSYGVHLQSDRAVMFNGTTYSSGAGTNRTVLFESGATLSAWSLTGGGNDVIFDRLTGATSDYGTITVTVSGLAGTKTITVTKTGLASST